MSKGKKVHTKRPRRGHGSRIALVTIGSFAIGRIASLVKLALKIVNIKTKKVDEFVDRLNHATTSGILFLFACLTSGVELFGRPIHCWVPADFASSHRKYTNSFCWVNNSYFLSFREYIPKESESYKRNELRYYQWLPFILFLQGVLFCLPNIMWRGLNSRSGVDMDDIISKGDNLHNLEKAEDKENTLLFIAKQMDDFLTGPIKRRPSIIVEKLNLRNRHFYGARLLMLYLFTKCLYLLNIAAQLLVLGKILGGTYNLFGFEILHALLTEHDWENQPLYFPRVTMCDLNIRRLGNVHRYTVQCLLPINLYAEKMYVFLWFWMMLVAGFTCWSLFIWLLRTFSITDSLNFIHGHLISSMGRPLDMDSIRIFVNNYLRPDGILVLRLIAHNTNNISTKEIICSIYNFWKNGNTKTERKCAC